MLQPSPRTSVGAWERTPLHPVGPRDTQWCLNPLLVLLLHILQPVHGNGQEIEVQVLARVEGHPQRSFGTL